MHWMDRKLRKVLSAVVTWEKERERQKERKNPCPSGSVSCMKFHTLSSHSEWSNLMFQLSRSQFVFFSFSVKSYSEWNNVLEIFESRWWHKNAIRNNKYPLWTISFFFFTAIIVFGTFFSFERFHCNNGHILCSPCNTSLLRSNFFFTFIEHWHELNLSMFRIFIPLKEKQCDNFSFLFQQMGWCVQKR